MSSLVEHSSLDVPSAVTLLMNVSVKVTVVLALAAIVCRLLKRQSAAVRHQVWTIAVAVSLLMPLAIGFMPHLPIAILPEQLVARVESGEAPAIAPVIEPETALISVIPRETDALAPAAKESAQERWRIEKRPKRH